MKKCFPVFQRSKEITRWSLKSLAQMSSQPLQQNATVLLQDVALRLDEQQNICNKLIHHVQNPSTIASSSSLSGTKRNRGGGKVIQATNMSVRVPFATQLKIEQERQLQIQKSIQQLQNLHFLHSDTLQLTQGIFLGNTTILDRFSKADQHLVQATLEQVRSRHAATVENLADIVIGLRSMQSQQIIRTGELDTMVEIFLRQRLGIQLLCDHYVALHKGKQPYGGIAVNCPLNDVLQDAVTEAKHICDANLNIVPEVIMPASTADNGQDAKGHHLTLVRPWTHHALVELLKNAMASVVQKAIDDGSQRPSPIYIQLKKEEEEDDDDEKLHIDIVDQGVGLKDGDNSEQVAFGFAQSSSLKRWDRIDEQRTYAMVRSPLQSLGVGLPLSRMMMQHFGGNVQLLANHHRNAGLDNSSGNKSRSNGCTARLTLLVDDEVEEYQASTVPVA
mmetsp:Transcript_12754/g.18109  ORF Transcript_12754/g.18109 Transcript_12754/m.18109 type:complete len:447 (+) Transcript_12754:127-1467(+)